MPAIFLTLRNVRLIVTGAALMLTVSLATAAIVMWIPESPVEPLQPERVVSNMNQYIHPHGARIALVQRNLRHEAAAAAR